MLVALFTTTPVAFTPPMVTMLPVLNPLPLIVTLVPPSVVPLAGLIPLIVGKAGLLIVKVTGMLSGLLLALGSITVIFVP
jgi:hypothetical protein